jgi:hypothetical protein
MHLFTDDAITNDEWRFIPVSSPRSIRMFYDASCLYAGGDYVGAAKPISMATSGITTVSNGFKNKFGVSFELNGLSQSDTLNGSHTSNGGTCPRSNSVACNANCSNKTTNKNCNSSITDGGHHKSGERLLNLLKTSSMYTIRVVGHALCSYNNVNEVHYGFGENGFVGGMALRGGKDSIVTTVSDTPINTLIQHELSHNLGIIDCSTYKCIMNASGEPELNNWCTNCQDVFWNKQAVS